MHTQSPQTGSGWRSLIPLTAKLDYIHFIRSFINNRCQIINMLKVEREFKQPDLKKKLTSISSNLNNFYSLEVEIASARQLQVREKNQLNN